MGLGPHQGSGLHPLLLPARGARCGKGVPTQARRATAPSQRRGPVARGGRAPRLPGARARAGGAPRFGARRRSRGSALRDFAEAPTPLSPRGTSALPSLRGFTSNKPLVRPGMSPPGRGRSWVSPLRGMLRCHPGQGVIWGGGSHLLNPKPPPPRSAGSLGSKLESVGLGQGGFLRGSSTSWGAPEWQPKGWGGRIGPGDPKKSPRRGGGCPVRAPGAAPRPRLQGESRVGQPQRVLWVVPSAPHQPRSSVGAQGYLLILQRRLLLRRGRGWGVRFLSGFYLCLKGWIKRRKKETAPAQPWLWYLGLGSRGGNRQGPPKPPLHASRGRVAPSLCAGSAQSPPSITSAFLSL